LTEKVTAAVLTAPRKIEIGEFEKPKLGPRDFLMRVKYCGICGSDLHIWDGSWNPPYPLILGHEFIGEVADAGSEALEWRRLREGDQIAVEMIIPCHRCEWCRRGLYNLCLSDDRSISPENGVEYGCNIPVERPPTALWGGYSQYLYVPENAIVHKFEDRVDWKEAALTEPLAVSARAVKRGGVQANSSVVVVGPGPIGLLAVVAAKAAGAKPIILTGTRGFRLKVGEDLGADHTVDITKVQNPVEEVRKLTNSFGADIVIETAGTPSAQEQSLRMVKKAGRVVMVGLTGERSLTINPDAELLNKELDVRASFLSAHTYRDAMEIIQSGRFELKRVITHIYPLRDVGEAFQAVMKREGGIIKALLDPWTPTAKTNPSSMTLYIMDLS